MSVLREITGLLWQSRNCPVCGAPKAGDLLCPDCRQVLDGLTNCPHCGSFIDAARYAEHACPRCPETAVMLACFPYTPALKARLRLIKYHHKVQVAASFGDMLIRRWQDFAGTETLAEAIVPVPLYPTRQAERGYNQAKLLAKPLARALHIPIYADAVRRVKDTQPQHSLSPAERAENLRDAFAAGRDLPKVAGKRVILFDDIITTGQTARCCAEILLAGGAAEVYSLAIGGHLVK